MGNVAAETGHRGLSTRERAILGEFMRKGRMTLASREVAQQFGIDRPLATKILLRLEKKGWLARGKRGLYIFVPLSYAHDDITLEDPWGAAMELFAPCFISGFSAAEYWDLTEQLFTTIVVFTTKRQSNNEQQIAHTRFLMRLIPAREMFGTQKIWRGNVPILVADRHRTIIDAVDRPDLAGGGRHMADMLRAYWKSGDTDPDRLLDYALTLGRGVLFKRLGFSAELFGNVSAAWLSACRQHISCGISKLDPAGPDTGPILTRWRLRANVRVEETT